MFNDVDLEVEGTPQQREYVNRSEHRGRSIRNAHCIQNSKLDIAHSGRLWRFGGLVREKCFRVDPHRAQISGVFFDQAQGSEIFVDTVLAEAHWHMEQLENHARYLRVMGNRTVEDVDIDEADFQQLLDELTDAKKSCTTPWVLAETMCFSIIPSFSWPRS